MGHPGFDAMMKVVTGVGGVPVTLRGVRYDFGSMTDDVSARSRVDDSPGRRLLLACRNLTELDRFVLVIALLFCLAIAPLAVQPSWSLRMAVVLLALPAGLIELGRLIRSHDRTALWAIAFLLAASLSAVMSEADHAHVNLPRPARRDPVVVATRRRGGG